MARPKATVNKSRQLIGEVLLRNTQSNGEGSCCILQGEGLGGYRRIGISSQKNEQENEARTKARKIAPAKAKAAAPSANGVLPVGASITHVKGLAGKVGGLAALKEIVDALQ